MISEALNKISPLYAVDLIAGAWCRATYDTPLSKIPVIGLKSSINPLGKQYRKAYALGEYEGKPAEGFFTKLAPNFPTDGPPVPQILKMKWR